MRIISGKFKGRQIDPPANMGIRPTTDRAREALFNLLDTRLIYEWEELDVLDLFCGSGAVSLEFLSRGVKSVTSVEQNPQVIKHLNTWRTKLELEDQWELLNESVETFLGNHHKQYDVVFLDPPYDMFNKLNLIETLFKDFLLEAAWVVLEHPTGEQFDSFPFFSETRNYSGSSFSLFFNVEIPPEVRAGVSPNPLFP